MLSPDQDEFGGFDKKFDIVVTRDTTAPLETINVADDIQDTPSSLEGQEKAPVTIKRAKRVGIKKVVKRVIRRKKLTRANKIIRLLLRKSGRKSIPPLDDLMRGKDGKKLVIKDIGIFAGTPKDPLVAGLAKDCMVGNTLNFSAEITKLRIVQIGVQILKAGRMHSPIHIAQIEENGSIQCVSGRHRLAFLILLYGADVKIPVYLEEMKLEEARDAMGVANDSRPAKASERAELAVLKALNGRSNVNQKDLYAEMATSKPNSRKYCVYSIMERGYPEKLEFKVSATSSRKDGGLTTLSSVETFLGFALEWNSEMKQEEFDKKLKSVVMFLNSLSRSFQNNKDFNPDFHMTTNPMTAIGKYYLGYILTVKSDPIRVVEDIARVVIEMGDVSRYNYRKIYNEIANKVTPKP